VKNPSLSIASDNPPPAAKLRINAYREPAEANTPKSKIINPQFPPLPLCPLRSPWLKTLPLPLAILADLAVQNSFSHLDQIAILSIVIP
jgi:hypothetical protein